MRVRSFLLAVALILFPAALDARPIVLTGAIGKAPVLAMIRRDGENLHGWYFYFSQGKDISLSGSDAQGNLRLEEKTGSRVTGFFEGKIEQAQWSGTWRDDHNRTSLPFVLRENNDPLAQLNAQLRCSLKKTVKDIGASFHTLDLKVEKGSVTRFAVSRGMRSKSAGDQACGIDLKSLRQEKSDVGILLKVSDGPHSGADSPGTCTIRLIGDGRRLFVMMGDWTEPDNHCRNSGDTMYCTPQAWWAGMIADVKSGVCRTVE